MGKIAHKAWLYINRHFQKCCGATTLCHMKPCSCKCARCNDAHKDGRRNYNHAYLSEVEEDQWRYHEGRHRKDVYLMH